MKEEINQIGKAAEKALDFVEKLVAAPLMEGTGILTDKISYWRFQNKINVILKAKQFLKEKNINIPKNIPIKDLSTLLEYSSFEEDDIMKDSWSKLLSNSLNPDNKFNSLHIFSIILNQLSVNEIYILNYMSDNSPKEINKERKFFPKKDLIENSSSDFDLSLIFIDNLVRLNLIEISLPDFQGSFTFGGITNGSVSYHDNFTSFRLSKFGETLVKQINI
ncbi:MAG: Abi-alpha family protein [Flavobacteriales bacterium]